MAAESVEVKGKRNQTRIQSVSRAIGIITSITSVDEGLTVKEVADQFELSTPTAYHLLNTLAYEGMLFKNERRRYVLGPSALAIADAVGRLNLVPQRYVKILNDLALESGETAYLSAWRNGAIAVVATVEGSHAVRVAGLSTGYSDNVHARASGKLLLAYASEELRDAVLERAVLRKVTANTIISRKVLDRELEEIRQTGFAYDRQEFREGVECISAPIRDGASVVSCFTLSCPADRFAAVRDGMITALIRASQAASHR